MLLYMYIYTVHVHVGAVCIVKSDIHAQVEWLGAPMAIKKIRGL